MSQALLSRIARTSLHKKVMKAEDTIPFFKNGMNLGWSGFTPIGYPKAVPIALADHVEKNNLQGKLSFNLFIGASVGEETEGRWASLDMIKRRWPYQGGKSIADAINKGKIEFGDVHLSSFASQLNFGFYTKEREGNLDIGVIEASEILKDGGIVLAGSVGAAPEVIERSDAIIVEINPNKRSLKGLHDIPPDDTPPFRRPYSITRVDDRIGANFVPCDSEKIIAIVESDYPDFGKEMKEADDPTTGAIANHILDFFSTEQAAGRLPHNLLPLQSGVGNIANAVIGSLCSPQDPKHNFRRLNVWTEVLQDTMLDFFDSGRLEFASTTSLSFSPKGAQRFYDNFDKYAPKVILRPQQISNNPELIRRLGVIAMNTPLEIDIYAHANSTLVGGSKMIHGIGGSGDFLRNAYISILHAPSARPSKIDKTGISTIVPMCSHVDHTEHDIQIVVTEQGLADLRGVAPKQRAKLIIQKCAHPDFKAQLLDYYEMAEKHCLGKKAGHEPQMLNNCFKMHLNLEQNGTMKLKSWN